MSRFAYFLILSLTTVSATTNAASCKEPKLEKYADTHPECQFYQGTRHFRAKEYSAALHQWQAIVDMQGIPREFEYLRVDAQNNLGFLYFMGLGVEQNKEKAIRQYWLPAENVGHEEATYHLCHAYSQEFPKLALTYCRAALHRYSKIGQPDRDVGEVIAQIQTQISRLEAK